MRKKQPNFNVLKILPYVLSLVVLFLNSTTVAQNKHSNNSPVFSNVVYQGDDQVYKEYPLEKGEFYNPILQGFYPDPAITKKGDDYYLVCSSFAMFPGVPIFHSKDLVNWVSLGGVLDNPATFDTRDCGISAGVYAPGITYNPFNNTFYMITTAFTGGLNNIIVKTKDPHKGWGDPIKQSFGGIDPSIFFDEDGKAYVVHNDAPNQGKELYNGHRVIKIWEYDLEKDDVIKGSDQIIVDGGVDLSKKPIWIEAPHIYKKDGFYYLMCAEGGTGGWHSEVIFKSKNPKGPYIPAPNNPILTQRYFPRERENKVDWAGHADIIEGPNGQWYGVFLAVRPNEEHRVNTGRETFILPVDWSGEFPVFINGLVPMEPKLKLPEGVINKTGQNGFVPNGNFIFTDDFSSEKLSYNWIGLRGPRENFISVKKVGLEITPFDTNIKQVAPTSTLFLRQMHDNFIFTVTLDYIPESKLEFAGITALQSESYNYVFGLTKKENEYYLVLQKNQKQGRRSSNVISEIIGCTKVELGNPIRLQVSAEGNNYNFSYSTNESDFQNIGGIVSGDILSTDVAGGFTGCLLGLYATKANDAIPE